MRIRITYNKSDPIRFTGHLDLHRVWERTFRRSQLPLSYSQGFNPQARIQIACALPLGFTSRCELLDFWLEGSFQVPEILSTLNRTIPPGISITKIEEVDHGLPALQTQVVSNEYEVTLFDPLSHQDLDNRLHSLLSDPSITRTWRNKSYDLRPLIEKLETATAPPGVSRIRMRLAARENATGRPEEVLAALGLNPQAARYERTEMILAA